LFYRTGNLQPTYKQKIKISNSITFPKQENAWCY